jgi:hypothetical protein
MRRICRGRLRVVVEAEEQLLLHLWSGEEDRLTNVYEGLRGDNCRGGSTKEL